MQKLIKNLNLIWNKFKKNNELFWNEIEEQMILNDVSVDTTEKILNEVRDYSYRENIRDSEKIKDLIKKGILKILGSGIDKNIILCRDNKDTPEVWMFVGVNGVGKTSTIVKIANLLKDNGKSVLLVAADTFRAAAFEQIDFYAKVLDLPIVHHQRHSDPGAVVYDGIEKAVARNIGTVLIDTAGRMHTSYNLLEELKKIKKVIFKKLNKVPDEIFMVIDSTTGQNAKIQIANFHEALSLTGIILTKTDGTAKGGILITIKNDFDIPIKFLTNGEKLDNIEFFDPFKYTENIIS